MGGCFSGDDEKSKPRKSYADERSAVSLAIELSVRGTAEFNRPLPPLAQCIHSMFESTADLMVAVGSRIQFYDVDTMTLIGQRQLSLTNTANAVASDGGAMMWASAKGVRLGPLNRGSRGHLAYDLPENPVITEEDCSAVACLREGVFAYASGRKLTIDDRLNNTTIVVPSGRISAIVMRDSQSFYVAVDSRSIDVLAIKDGSLMMRTELPTDQACITGLTRLPNKSIVAADSSGNCLWVWSERETQQKPRRFDFPTYKMIPHDVVLKDANTLLVSCPYANALIAVRVQTLFENSRKTTAGVANYFQQWEVPGRPLGLAVARR